MPMPDVASGGPVPSPKGLLLTSSGCVFRLLFTSTTSQSTGVYTSAAVFTDSTAARLSALPPSAASAGQEGEGVRVGWGAKERGGRESERSVEDGRSEPSRNDEPN